jgi:hypothetical protein
MRKEVEYREQEKVDATAPSNIEAPPPPVIILTKIR